ncbi:hypothetical protein BDQ17DRAFT_1367553 [Cyathus striatus]|nr:hypothetical protein BDQ17DRAFT_1367553 [Cyathus striatus]
MSQNFANSFAILLFSFIAAFLFWWIFQQKRESCSKAPHAMLLDEIHDILYSPNTSERVLLTQRADANKRLTSAFHLTNTFVSGDPDVHRKFVRHARQLLKDAHKNLTELNTHLRRLVPDEDEFPNPLDFVIPAWETLWRVVAIVVAHVHHDAEIRCVFKDFASSPGEVTFRECRSEGVSVKDVTDEAMRVYPPSKHIGRAALRPWARFLPESILRLVKLTPFDRFLYHTMKADIVAIEKSPSLWGPESNLTPEKEHVLKLVFGYGPHRCIGESWAPVASGVIVSTILECLDGSEWRITEGLGIGGRDGWDGWRVVGGLE